MWTLSSREWSNYFSLSATFFEMSLSVATGGSWTAVIWVFKLYSVFMILKAHSCSGTVSTFFITAHLFCVGNGFVFCMGVLYRSFIINSLIPKKCFWIISVSFHVDFQTALLQNLKYLNRVWFARWELHQASMHSAGWGDHSFWSWYSGLLKYNFP